MQQPGRYTIQEEIASGSTATVFLAEDAVLRRKVALKKLHPHLLNHPETVKRFEQEAVAVARISHENIIRVYDFGNQDRNLYLAMEYVDGFTLESLVARFGAALPLRVCHSVFHQLMNGLSAAHKLGIVHRDIKPSNLLVDRNGLVRIADFGIAFLAEEKNITKTGAYLGTPVYSAPEQARCRPASVKSDIFSSGILFYRCLTGRLPFDGESPHAILAAILEKTPVKPALANPRILPGFSELTLSMLAKDPLQRPTAEECLRELEVLAGVHGMPIEPDRIRRFLDDGPAYAAEEGREMSLHFLARARAAREEGRTRQAVKFAAQAEIHGGVPEEALPEVRRIRTAGKTIDRRRVLAAAGLAAACLGAGGLELRERAEKARRVPFAVSRPDPGPAPSSSPEPGPIAPPDQPPAAREAALTTAVAADPAPAAPLPAKKRKPASRPVSIPLGPTAQDAPGPKEGSIPAKGFLIVKTNPPFAQVSLDGRRLGTTPFQSPVEVPAGRYDLLIEREGCLPATAQVLIEPGRPYTLRLALEKAESASR